MPPHRRLYLDTADLITLADSQQDRRTDDLRAVLIETHTYLVISRTHLQDARCGEDPASTERFIRMLQFFQPILFPHDDPSTVEPLGSETADILFGGSSDIRSLVQSPAAKEWLADAHALQSEVHAGAEAVHASRQSAPRITSKPPARVAHATLATGITLIRGWLGPDPNAIVEHHETERNLSLSPGDRATLLHELSIMRTKFEPLRSRAETLELDDLLQRVARVYKDPGLSPGSYWWMETMRAKAQDNGRPPRRSDVLDAEHTQFFPYVDFATCDGHTMEAIKRLSRHKALPRAPWLALSTHLDDVIQALGDQPLGNSNREDT